MWMASVEGMSPTGTAGLGFLLPVANPKELALTIGAGLTIGEAGLPPAATVSLALCYTVIACLTVIVPIAAFVVDRDRMVLAGPEQRHDHERRVRGHRLDADWRRSRPALTAAWSTVGAPSQDPG
jgi:hypothetical protein